MLQKIHDDDGHQGLDQTLALAQERFYWSEMYQDISNYVTNCPCFQVAEGHYVGPSTKPGSLAANKPMDILCTAFMKIYQSRDSKENVLILSDNFSMFSPIFVLPNQ